MLRCFHHAARLAFVACGASQKPIAGFLRPCSPLPLGIREKLFRECFVAYGAFLAVGQSVAFCTQPRVWSHVAVVGETQIAFYARLAAHAASVESTFELFPTMSEF